LPPSGSDDAISGETEKPWPPIADEFSTRIEKSWTYLLLSENFAGHKFRSLPVAIKNVLVTRRANPDEEHGERLIAELGGAVDFTLVWVHYPKRYTKSCNYYAHGNEPILETLYIAAALTADVPRFGTHKRHINCLETLWCIPSLVTGEPENIGIQSFRRVGSSSEAQKDLLQGREPRESGGELEEGSFESYPYRNAGVSGTVVGWEPLT
jgi:hypothetical protein